MSLFMGKLFFAVCFFFSGCLSFEADAAVRSVADANAALESSRNPIAESTEISQARQQLQGMSSEEMEIYLKERLQKVVKTTLDKGDGLGGDGAINAQKSLEQIEKENEAKKSTFERIYDNAMNKLISPKDPQPTAKLYTPEDAARRQAGLEEQKRRMLAAQHEAWKKANIDVIEATLPPAGTKTLIPAQEHIPYLFSRIELTPDGLTNISDTIVIVANGENLKKGVTRAFPKYVLTREGKRQKIDFQLLGVNVNGQEIPYKTVERGNYIFLEPQNDDLRPGVYTYQFNYLIDNQIFRYNEFDEFYWDITGSVWNLVIARAGAALIMPPNTKPLGQTAVSGYPGLWDENAVIISKEADNVLGFVSPYPLFIGQGMQIIVSIPKGSISNLTPTKRFLLFMNEFGDIVFSVLGLTAILLSYFFSWRYIRKNKNYKVLSTHKDGPILRYLRKGLIDRKSFGAFLLDLYRKNIIDIEENDGNILLVKKTDNVKSLSKYEKKAVNNLFTGSEAVLNVNSYSMLKIKRALDNITKGIRQQIKFISLKLNIGYILFSVGMLVFAELGIAALAIDTAYTAVFMLACTAAMAFNIFLIRKKYAKKWLGIAVKILAGIFLAFEWFLLCAVVHPATALIFPAIIYIIMEYSKLYAQRGGLLSASVNDAKEYNDLLVRKAADIGLGKEFVMNQAAIFAMDAEEYYRPNDSNKNYYKLDIINELIKKI